MISGDFGNAPISQGLNAPGADLTNVCPDVCVKDSETDPF